MAINPDSVGGGRVTPNEYEGIRLVERGNKELPRNTQLIALGTD